MSPNRKLFELLTRVLQGNTQCPTIGFNIENIGFKWNRRSIQKNPPITADFDFADDTAWMTEDIKQVKDSLHSVHKKCCNNWPTYSCWQDRIHVL